VGRGSGHVAGCDPFGASPTLVTRLLLHCCVGRGGGVLWTRTDGRFRRYYRGHVQSPYSSHQLHIGVDQEAREGESAEVSSVHCGGFQEV
jgi:hypothetical protein